MKTLTVQKHLSMETSRSRQLPLLLGIAAFLVLLTLAGSYYSAKAATTQTTTKITNPGACPPSGKR